MSTLTLERVGCGLSDLDEILAASVPKTEEEIEAKTFRLLGDARTVEEERRVLACGAGSIALLVKREAAA